MTAHARSGTPLIWLAEAVNAVAALRAAARLGVLESLEARPADVRSVAAGCGITEHGATVLLEALAALGLIAAVGDAPSPAFTAPAGTTAMAAALPRSADLVEVIRSGSPYTAGDTTAGAAVLYKDLVGHLGMAMRDTAARVAALISRPAGRVLDVGAGAAPVEHRARSPRPSCEVTALDLPGGPAGHPPGGAGRRPAVRFRFLPGDAFSVNCSGATTWCCWATCVLSSAARPTERCSGGCGPRCGQVRRSRSSTYSRHWIRTRGGR